MTQTGGDFSASHRRDLTRLALFGLLFIPLILFLPGIGGFPYPGIEQEYSDISLAHFPYTLYLRRSLLLHHIPLWSPLFFSGSPFAANPLSGIWYPPGWPALLFPLPLGFTLLIMLHLLWGGIGTVNLLRSEGLDLPAAVFGGVGFIALPKLIAHYGAGHLTLLYAIPWTPWLLWATRKKAFLLEPAFLALIFLADPRWGFYAGLLWFTYRLFGPNLNRYGDRFKTLVARLADSALAIGAGALMAAPLAVPLLEFTRLSTRNSMDLSDIMAYSLPLPRLLGLAVPDFHGFHEYMMYAGQAALLLIIILLFVPSRRRLGIYWLATAMIAMLFALGENLLPFSFLTAIPLLNLLRVPSRWLFVAGIAIVMLAAHGLQVMIDGPIGREKRRINLLVTGFALFQIALFAVVWLISRQFPLNFSWAAVQAAASAVWIGIYSARRISVRVWLIGIFTLALIDWCGLDRSLFIHRPFRDVLSEGQAVAQRLQNMDGQQGLFRVYSPSNSIPQQTSAFYNLQLVNGVDPLQLETYVNFLRQASGIPWDGYSVTAPAFEKGDPSQANRDYQPDPVLLGLLNARYLAAEFPLDAEGLVFEGQIDQTYLYLNESAHPRAWVQPDHNLLSSEYRSVAQIDWSPDRISIHAFGPGLLVLSEISYPGWRVWVDGEIKPLQTFAGLLRSVELDFGEHEIVFAFRPISVTAGLGIGVLAWLFWGVVVIRRGWTFER